MRMSDYGADFILSKMNEVSSLMIGHVRCSQMATRTVEKKVGIRLLHQDGASDDDGAHARENGAESLAKYLQLFIAELLSEANTNG